jgi:pyruvate,water dikinase
MHYPEPMHPFDSFIIEANYLAVSAVSSRVFVLPAGMGTDLRIVNGYLCESGVDVHDPDVIAQRVKLFRARAGYYYENWDGLYDLWVAKVKDEIRGLESVVVPEMSEFEPESSVLEARGLNSAHDLLIAFNRVLESADRIWHYHFEFLALGYAAYLSFQELCRALFPDMTEQTIVKMVSGVDVLLYRPDDELKKLAALALEFGVGEVVESTPTLVGLRSVLADSEPGQRWLSALDESMSPWFNFSLGPGFYHQHRSWVDKPEVPLTTLVEYIGKLRAGESIARPTAALAAERDAVTAAYRRLIGDDTSRQEFDNALALAKTVFPYVEDHNFYVEHWYHTVFWNKVREFGALLVAHDFMDDVEDVFFLQRLEVLDALGDLRLSWATGSPPFGRMHWGPIIERRKAILASLRQWTPPPALGPAPTDINEPLAVMLYGLTKDRIDSWLAMDDDASGGATLSGFAASPGVVEGHARVVMSVEELELLQEGEILIAPSTLPSWARVFGKIGAAVSDVGGMMCHAAIVAREYGLPAVVGTVRATTTIKTGQLVRVDGSKGEVTVL